MLRDISDELHKSTIVALNRYLDMALIYFNAMVALMLLVAPWYIMIEDGALMQDGVEKCKLPAGTVIAPFASKCDNVAFIDLLDGGAVWNSLHIYSFIYLGLALLASCLVGYEVISHGVREWRDANTIGFAIQIVMLVMQILIMTKADKAVKPTPEAAVDGSTAEILIITAVVLSSLRVATLMFFMYLTYRYNPRGTFGTGSFA
jgi:hypothetical protein